MSKKEDILAAMQPEGRLAKYDRSRFVVINDLWLGYGTSDYYGAHVKDLQKIPKHIEDISAVAPVISFAHGIDEPEVGLCLFESGKCITRFHYFSVETIKLVLRISDSEAAKLQAECVANFDSGELRRFGVSDGKIEELGAALRELAELDDEDEWHSASDVIKDILEFDFGKIDEDRTDGYETIDGDGGDGWD
jgi:hypothetical protein